MRTHTPARRAVLSGRLGALLAVVLTVSFVPAVAGTAHAGQQAPGVRAADLGLVGHRSGASSSTAPGSSVPGEVLVRWRKGVTTTAKSSLRTARRVRVLHTVSAFRTDLLRVPAGTSVTAEIAALRADPRVEAAQPNYRYTAQYDLPSALWGMKNTGQNPFPGYALPGNAGVDVDGPGAWAVTEGSASVVVGVIDTGVYISHPELSSNIWTNPTPNSDPQYPNALHGWNFFGGNNQVYVGHTCSDGMNEDLHGTHVSGTIAAADNGAGVQGVAPAVQIMPLKVIGCSEGGDSSGDSGGIIDALAFAAAHGVKIVNMSLGGPGYDPAFASAVASSGILVVAAAGNGDNPYNGEAGDDITSYPEYPASFPAANLVAVAAVDNRGELASFSNYSSTEVDLGAPGVDVLSSIPPVTTGSGTYYYAFLDGTSMAAPHVTGTAALVLSQKSGYTAAQLKSALLTTVTPDAALSGKTVSGGLVDAARAIGASGTPPPTPATTSAAIGRSASTITYGQSVLISTQLSANSAGLQGYPVELQAYGLSGWSVTCRTTTNASGQASCWQKPPRNTSYMWHFAGDFGHTATFSSYPGVSVRPNVSSGLKYSRIRLGQSSALRGSLAPRKTSSPIWLQAYYRGSWHTVFKGRTSTASTYSFTLKPRKRGYYAYRAYFPGDASNVAQSTSRRVLGVR